MTKRKQTSNRKNRRARYNGPARGLGAGMSGAPAGVSQDLQQFTNFYPAPKGRDGITIHTCAALFNVLKDCTNAVGVALEDSAGVKGLSCQMNLTDPARLSDGGGKGPVAFLTPVFDLIASAFVRYKVKKLIFHYEPQASATDSQRLVFAFANDPLHPVMWNATVPTQGSLLGLADSIAFMPWKAWSMDVTHKLGDSEFFTFSDASTTVTEFVERFSDFGVISCITSGVSAGADASGGVLYMETEIELREFCPISVTRPASLLRLTDRLRDEHGRRAEKSYSVPKVEVVQSKASTCQHGLTSCPTC